MTTAAELIRRSYYLAQVLDPNEEIEGFESSEGLYELNRILDRWGSLSQYIPSYSELIVNVTPGVFSYDQTPVITQLSEGHLLDINNVQYGLNQLNLQQYNTLNFPLSATSPCRPRDVFIKNDFVNWPTKSQIIFYPVPDTTYTAVLYAMLRLVNVTYSQVLSQLPGYWITGVEYELAKQFINIYSTTPAATFFDDYEKIIAELKAANRRDRSVQTKNVFQNVRRYKPWGTYVD
jgi:hypothetical protein